jgi:hypothetical protein
VTEVSIALIYPVVFMFAGLLIFSGIVRAFVYPVIAIRMVTE